jgi:hypothetical protein
LGGAVQALWAARRMAGEADLSCDAVAAPFVRFAAAGAPEPARAAATAALRERFRGELLRLHPSAG